MPPRDRTLLSMQPPVELVWILAFATLCAALVRGIRGSLLEPIADGPRHAPRAKLPVEEPDEEQPETDRAPSRLRHFPVLASAVGMTFALRMALLLVLHR